MNDLHFPAEHDGGWEEKRRGEIRSLVIRLSDAASKASRLDPRRIRADTLAVAREALALVEDRLDEGLRQTTGDFARRG